MTTGSWIYRGYDIERGLDRFYVYEHHELQEYLYEAETLDAAQDWIDKRERAKSTSKSGS